MKEVFKKIVVAILTYEAKLVLNKYNPKTILITGSVGKTSTKDAMFQALGTQYFVRKAEKSFNSEVGVPLTILGLQNGWTSPYLWLKNIIEGLFVVISNKNYPEWLILEVGADHPGDIKRVADWVPADMVVLTRLPDVPVHVEYFSSPEEVIQEKAQIIRALKPDGVILANADDIKILEILQKHTDKKMILYGVNKESNVRAINYGVISKDKVPQGARFHIKYDDQDVPFEILGGLGKQHMYPVLASVAAGVVLGIPLETLKDSFHGYDTPSGRMKILRGIKETTLIDDTYNSSPVASEEALNLLSVVQVHGRKIIVLGDMMELGRYSIEEHRKVGKMVAGIADILVTVGPRARHIAEGAGWMSMHGSKIFQYDDVARAGKELEHFIEKGDIVLAKASQSIRLEKLIEEIMLEPEKKDTLLVRQDKEWQSR